MNCVLGCKMCLSKAVGLVFSQARSAFVTVALQAGYGTWESAPGTLNWSIAEPRSRSGRVYKRSLVFGAENRMTVSGSSSP